MNRADGVDRTDRADGANKADRAIEADRAHGANKADKADRANGADGADGSEADVEEPKDLRDPNLGDSQVKRQRVARQAATRLFFFFFCIVFCLFFSSSEAKTYGSAWSFSSSFLFSVGSSIKREASSSKYPNAEIRMSSYNNSALSMSLLLMLS